MPKSISAHDPRVTQNVQDYLKVIYGLTVSGGQASTSALAARLGIAPASVTGMLQKLASRHPALVRYHKHQGARLTPDGERAALEVIRHHRLLEAYLVDRLGFSGETVHAEACRLEHVISEEFEARIDEQLGHPAIDPHGAPIPSSELVMPNLRRTPLSSLRPGDTAVVRQVASMQAGLRLELEELELFPGVRLAVIARDPASGSLTLSTSRRPSFEVSAAACEQLQVEQDA